MNLFKEGFFRWLIAKGRQDEARHQILIASKINGASVPQDVLYPEKGNLIINLISLFGLFN